MAALQLARGVWTGFAVTESPFNTPNGMDENLRTIDDHLALYTLLPPLEVGTALPGSPTPGDGQIFDDGSYAVFNAGAWKIYQPLVGLVAAAADGSESWRNTGSGWALSFGFSQSGVAGVIRTALAKMREQISALDGGAVGDGVTNDRAALQKVFDSRTDNFTVDFQHRDFHVGAIHETSGPVFLFNGRRGIRFINPGRIIVTNGYTLSNNVVAWQALFKFTDCEDLDLDVHAVGSAYDKDYPKGVAAVEIQTTQADTRTRRYHIRSRCENGHAALEVNRPSSELGVVLAGAKVSAGDFVVDLFAKNCEYGARFNRNGIQVQGLIRTDNVARAFFPVDTWGHQVKVISSNHTKFTDVLIKSYSDDVSDIDVDYFGHNFGPASYAVYTQEFQNDAQNTSMKRIRARISCDGLSSSNPIIIGRQYSAAGALQATTNSVTDDIFIEYNTPQAYSRDTILFDATPAKQGMVHLSGKYANCMSTNGFTVRRGDFLVCNRAGAFNAGGGDIAFFVDGLYVEQGVYCELEIFADADFSTSASAEAYQKWYFRMSVDTVGSALTILGLTKDVERLFNGATAPNIVGVIGLSDFTAKFTVTGADFNTASARLHARLRMISDSI